MANELAMFDPKGGVPAHIAQHFDEAGTNIENRASVPSLSPQGKIWTIAIDGNKTQMMRTIDGEQQPVGVLPVVILDYAKRRGRTYYEGAYDPKNEQAPICWSDDGVAPDESVPEEVKSTKTSHKCATCPMSAKGSKIGDNGLAQVACSQHRMLAVVPAGKLDFEPLRLKIAMTSDWDKESPDAAATGWYAFQNYIDYLKSRGAQRTDSLVTKMKFDTNAAYPKIFFAAERWLNPDELTQVAPLAKTEKVQALLGGTWTPAGPDGVKKNEQVAAPAEVKKEAAKPAPVDDEAGEISFEGLGAPADSTPQGGAQASQAPAEPVTTKANPKAAAAPAVEEPAAATTKLDPGLADLLADWGD